MNPQWHERLAQDRRERLMKEARLDEQLRQAGLRTGPARAEQALALLILAAPVVLLLVRTWIKA